MRRRVSSNKLVEALRGVKGFKTNLGYKSPGECFLYDSQWVCILKVFKDFPLIDHKFYGTSIFTYRNELKQTGVKVDFEDAVKEFSNRFKQQASYMTKENVLSFLLCCRQLKNTHVFPPDLKNYIREGKWLQTRHGRKRPSECILFGPDWQSICPITDLPFIDGDNCYGKDIHEYKKELKSMGVVVEFKDGAKFVAAGLLSPLDPTCITPANVFSLLECIRILLKDKNYSFPDAFFKNISQKWLKTTNGYRPPHECLLFDSNENPSWGSYLKQTDGPFIDEDFYGSNITLYKKELQEIGVTIDFKEGCSLIASHLDAKKELKAIVRVYNYLSQFNWEPDVKLAKWIWIPNGKQDGKWVSPSKCVLHDKDGLFSSELKVLEKYYEQKLLNFFSRAFGVRCNPSVDHYCKLWEGWQSSGYRLSHDDCRKFWGYVLKYWSEKTEKTLTDKLVKLPVASGSDEILLFSKDDVFIADDLQLKDLFEQFSPQPIFVWYPQPSLPSLPQTKLLEIYRKIGVRTISESVEKEESFSVDVAQLNEVNPKEFLIKKDLVLLILGFLADPVMKMEAERRHETIRRLLNDTFLETVEPITVNYSLSLSSGEIVKATASRMIRWDREASKFFTQKLDRSSGFKNLIEYATYFSEAISEGVLWENNDHIGALTELIKLAFMLEFNEEAVLFLMKSKNLQIFLEDKEFLASAFLSD